MGEDWSDRLIGAAYNKGNSGPRRWVWPVTLAAVLPCLLLAAFVFQGQVGAYTGQLEVVVGRETESGVMMLHGLSVGAGANWGHDGRCSYK